MIQTLKIGILAFLFSFSACKQSSSNTQKQEIEPSKKPEIVTTKNKVPNDVTYFCDVDLDNLKNKASNIELKSSNGLKNGTIATNLNIVLNKTMYEKHALNVELVKVQKTDSPKLVVGSYIIKALMNEEEIDTPYFDFIGNVVDNDTYKSAKEAGIIEDIEDSFVLLSKTDNKLNITSIKDYDNEENSELHQSGVQVVEGNFLVNLLKIATKEKITLKVNFKGLHEWNLSKAI
ncbi:hypothetical protein [Tenacibaculum sp. 190524A02b]|uniref:hypothetical protein n=1 Tax=Tenacibaculum vairaonense TaxID=3137860 RepID=UPI0031FB119D